MSEPRNSAVALGKAFTLIIANVLFFIVFVTVSTLSGLYFIGAGGLAVGLFGSIVLGLLFLLVVDLFVIFGGLDWLRLRAADDSEEEPVEPAD